MKSNQKVKLIKTFTVKRQVEQEYTVKRIVTKDVEVDPLDLSSDEINELDAVHARALAIAFKYLLLNQAKDVQSYIDTSKPKTIVATSENNSSPEEVKDDNSYPHSGHAFNYKSEDASSKYHNVCMDKRTSKFTASPSHNGTAQHLGAFDNELKAAFAVDEFLDSINDTKRIRNYNEFPEVLKYKQSQA